MAWKRHNPVSPEITRITTLSTHKTLSTQNCKRKKLEAVFLFNKFVFIRNDSLLNFCFLFVFFIVVSLLLEVLIRLDFPEEHFSVMLNDSARKATAKDPTLSKNIIR